jgi:hypothetical protein
MYFSIHILCSLRRIGGMLNLFYFETIVHAVGKILDIIVRKCIGECLKNVVAYIFKILFSKKASRDWLRNVLTMSEKTFVKHRAENISETSVSNGGVRWNILVSNLLLSETSPSTSFCIRRAICSNTVVGTHAILTSARCIQYPRVCYLISINSGSPTINIHSADSLYFLESWAFISVLTSFILLVAVRKVDTEARALMSAALTQLETPWRIDDMVFWVTRHTPWRIEFNSTVRCCVRSRGSKVDE